MEFLPHLLLEGFIVSAYALGVSTGYIYVRGEFKYIIGILEKALDEAYRAGMLGKNILGSGFNLDISVGKKLPCWNLLKENGEIRG